MSRTPKYTPKTINAILDSLRLGLTYERACAVAGITRQTFWAWRTPEQEDFKPDLVDLIEKAEAEAVEERLEVIRKAANKNWTAAAWWLERRHPKEFGRPYGDSPGTVITTIVCPPDWSGLGDALRLRQNGRHPQPAPSDANGRDGLGASPAG